ncbi:uncharacterized protein LOC6042546 [Culex quinquefasciatus]|uniref:uncharacterized protein LOC6042546 n=1 Tax=Culex quinquefasciatus TaxID=7176 RepID=UPI0018E39AF2|nr:uncharacterized protein LOC6042546 [Culex quinquefasciatus]
MNYLLHRQRTPGAVIPVPEELKELMSEISREVLRAQPPSPIHFIADYLEAKLVRRENQVVANRVVDTVLDTSLNIIELLDELGIDKAEKAERAVAMIREAFRKHFQVRTSDESLREAFREAEVLKRLVDECGFTEQEALKAGKVIERAYRTYFLRNVYKEYHGPAVTSDWKEAAEHTLGVYAASGATKEEMNRAVIRIQQAYRAYYSKKRRNLDRKATIIQQAVRKHQEKQVTSGVLNELIDDAVDPKFRAREEILRIVDMVITGQVGEPEEKEKEEAATMIQSVFRGRQTRKKFANVGWDSSPEPGPSNTVVADPANDDLDGAATLVQSLARGHLVRRQIQKEQSAAVKIQSYARGHLARKQHSQQQDN